MYHLENNLVSVGLVTGLGYSNPYLSPDEEFAATQDTSGVSPRFLKAASVSPTARARSAPADYSRCRRRSSPVARAIGDDAGFLNASRIKGSHGAIKSGMLAAEACFDALTAGRRGDELTAFPETFQRSWLYEELYKARNFKPLMAKG